MGGNPAAPTPPETPMKISTLKPGQRVAAGYRKWSTPCTFMGFGLKHADSVRWGDLNEVYFTADCKNLKGLEAWADARKVTVYAVFRDPEDGAWAAYLYKNRFRVGTSADALELAEVA